MAGLAMTGCATTQATSFKVGARQLPPKPAGAPIELFKSSPPTRSYAEVAQFNVHLEKTFFIPSALPDALPQLEDLARRAGADALINIVEHKSRLNETFIYNVTAAGIVFTDLAATEASPPQK